MEKQTSTEWLFEQLWNSDKDKFIWHSLLEQAKELEKQQSHEYAEFAIRCDRKEMKILNFDGFIKLF
jgi:hypothetical protein